MKTARMMAVLLAMLSAAALGRAGTFTYTISDVTNAPAPNGSYNDGTFIHGVNKFTFDVLFSLSPTSDDWTGGGVQAVTMPVGVRWFYSPDDPNVVPTAPGTSGTNRFSTFVCNPASQFGNARFISPTSNGGAYLAGINFIRTANEFNIAWLESPPATTSRDTDAAVVRLTLDTLGTPYTMVRAGTSILPGETKLARIQVASASADNGGTLTLLNFNLYGIPEPATSGLLLTALGVLSLAARSSTRHPLRNPA